MKKISIREINQLPNPNIIDVRETYEYEMGNIPNSRNIPLDDLIDNPEKYLNHDEKHYIYCETSFRSSRVCDFLSDFGYNVYLIDGGYKAWITENGQKK